MTSANLIFASLIDRTIQEIGVGTRTNGYGGFGPKLRGHFNSAGLGQTLLFVNSKTKPTILIERSDAKPIYISLDTTEATNEVYEALSQIKLGEIR